MNNKLLWTIPLMLMSLSPTLAQDLTAEERAAVEAEVHKRIKVTSEKMTSPALARVFAPTFIEVKVKIMSPDGSTMTHDFTMAKMGDGFIDLEDPTTNMAMPNLHKAIRKDLRIKTDADAKIFEQALDVLHPISGGFGDRDKAFKAIRHADNTWTFVRGKFFKDRKGFVVTTDAAGVVKSVRYSLDLPAE